MKRPVLTIVVPCYNEEEVIERSCRELRGLLARLVAEKLVDARSKLLFVDDGSRDRTWAMLQGAHARHPQVAALKLSRNVGHQKALFAGLEAAVGRSDCIVTVDADLQDDIRVIRDFVLKYHEGYDVVYGVRARRPTDTWFKRTSARAFYKLMVRLGIELVPDHADFRLMSKRAVAQLCRFGERNPFLRGMVPLVGFPSANVTYERQERTAGISKYTLRRMVSLALDGIAGFSVAPIRIVTTLGFGLLAVSLAASSYALYQKWTGRTDAGWTSLMLTIWFLGGLQLLGMGILGEYIGKIFVEVKGRPRYAVEADLFNKPPEPAPHKPEPPKPETGRNPALLWTE